MRHCRFVTAFALTFACTLGAQVAPPSPHRAILISFDGFNEAILRTYADSAAAPHIWAMFAQSTCAESVRPAFPSVTPASHATIWTGAWPRVSGIAASMNGTLPLATTTVLDGTDGFKAASLRAEPVWIAAARQGKSVFSHMATQSPQPPGYAPVAGPTAQLDSERARAARAVGLPNLAALNIYNDLVALAHVVRSPVEMDWAIGDAGDSLHARILDDSSVAVRLNHDAKREVIARLAPADTASPHGRPLARFFSEPLRVDLPQGRRTFVFFRLWELSHDRSRLLLFVSEARVIQANRPDIALAYDDAVGGALGNGAGRLLERGEFGPRVPNGGDGAAELRYLETAELLTRQFMKGTEWGWKTYRPELLLDYLPYPDEVLHTFLGFADPGTPGVSPAGHENAARMLKRGYELVDVRMEQMQRLAASAPSTRLFVTGDHGMRPTWMLFKPNVALRDAGLLALDSAGKIDLRRSKAVTAPGGWIAVNRVGRKDGIVPADSVDAVMASAERALLASHVVTRIFRASTAEGDSLGLGGPVGGDLYFDLAPGYFVSAATTGPLSAPMNFPMGEHGFPSIDHDMHPLLCMSDGPGRRIGEVRSIDVAPTVSAWLGISPPAEALGHSLLGAGQR
jgi:Type I phosphodiesterase / nucleotide pyrophosphatase